MIWDDGLVTVDREDPMDQEEIEESQRFTPDEVVRLTPARVGWIRLKDRLRTLFHHG